MVRILVRRNVFLARAIRPLRKGNTPGMRENEKGSKAWGIKKKKKEKRERKLCARAHNNADGAGAALSSDSQADSPQWGALYRPFIIPLSK